MKSAIRVLLWLAFATFYLVLLVMCDTEILITKVVNASEGTGPHQLAGSEFKNSTLPAIRLQNVVGVANKTNKSKSVIEDMDSIVFPDEYSIFNRGSIVTTLKDVVTVRTKSDETTTSAVDINGNVSNIPENRFTFDGAEVCPEGRKRTKSGICLPEAKQSGL